MQSTLFKRTTTGAIQVWWQELEVDNDLKYTGRYRTHSGKQGGKIVTSEWTVAKPKNTGRSNATTPGEQAVAEVEATYAKKLKSDYHHTVEDALASTKFKPMLAEMYDDYRALVIDMLARGLKVWLQAKLNGLRCNAKADGLWSRTGEPINSCPHIWEAVKNIFEVYPDIVIDGELYNHLYKEDLPGLQSMIRTTKPSAKHILKTAEFIQYHIYDTAGPSIGEEDMDVRYDFAKEVYPLYDTRGLLYVVETVEIHSIEELDAFHAQLLADGYEGSMIRLIGGYENKRTKKLLKRKEFVDSEFEIIEILEGEGNSSGGARVVWLKLDTDPTKKFKADIVGPYAERQEVWKNPKRWVGKMATVKYFKERSPAGIPLYAKLTTMHMQARW